MSTDLLDCPFCGGEAERVDNGPTKAELQNALSWGGDVDDGGLFIRCKSCDASTALHFDRKENLLSSWNRRAFLKRRQLAVHLAALDSIALREMSSTVALGQAELWREYLARADGLLSFISEEMSR